MENWIDETRKILGTAVRLIVCCERKNDDKKVERAFEECRRIERVYSRFLEGNQLSRLNLAVGKWVKVSKEMYDFLKLGRLFWEQTEGVFDLRVKKILESWGYDDKDFFDKEDLRKKESVNSKQDYEKNMVVQNFSGIDFKTRDFVKLDAPIELGALGKGYAIDKMVACLKGMQNFSVNAGGDIFARGRDFEGKIWRFLLEHPLDVKQAIGFVEVDGFALACSSPTKRKWHDKHHLVDVVNGCPANDMLAVYTQAEIAFMADAYSTALFVIGFEKAKKLLEKIKVEAMLVSSIGEIFRTKGFEGELFLG